ncbi:hypothetical protein SAMN02746073_1763 [Legionella jamestowniensis DSM 19215]|nr:hypothetical protein SAMN02746073_1763 [Legionella jamestowniensis DSM 19215]
MTHQNLYDSGNCAGSSPENIGLSLFLINDDLCLWYMLIFATLICTG